MLDKHGRKFVQPLFNKLADIFIKVGFSANQVTVIAFLIGITPFFLILNEMYLLAVVMLWISGILDAVDGTIARKTEEISLWGTLMDITFDRIVEVLIIIALAIKYTEYNLSLLILSTAIIFSMTVFLTVGALSAKNGIKSFYYQAGLAERTEGFIFFSLMLLLPNILNYMAFGLATLIFITGIQRMLEAKKIFLEVDLKE